ncbi:DUF4214 domain-containing protein [Vreelandella salicampi]|uniref:DUF4214 domain-containing protein n=1 Tax=Vreelandella salicampi TaxID=1449798 RepID=A0A7Z0LNY1_9GAMM|nr:DUF4214 domain-containing protein [Halomonas salicampi]NYS62416.1 DUF4214 domain-containing protein [Halomonas salicampi]
MATFSFNNLDASRSYTEGGAPITVDNDIALSGSPAGNFTGGTLQFSLSDADSGDTFSLVSDSDPKVDGAISFDGDDVYLGNGTERDKIGVIDSTLNGQNGQDLKINFSSPLTNGSFESGDTAGWTVYESEYDKVTLGGQTTDYYYNDGTTTGSGAAVTVADSASVSYRHEVQQLVVNNGDYALNLTNRGSISFTNQTPTRVDGEAIDGYGSWFGPYVVSDPFTVENAGASIAFDWSAQNGGDSYDVFGYLVDLGADGAYGGGDDSRTKLFSERGDSRDWTTESIELSSAGTYAFEFVSGTYDQTGGKGVGASLYIDAVRLISGEVTSESTVSAIAQKVTFASTAEDTVPSRTLTVSAKDAENNETSATMSLDTTQLNDAPSFTGDATLDAVDEDSTPAGEAVSALFGSLFSDVDATYEPKDTLAGIAVTDDTSQESEGHWQYSTDAGAHWFDLESVGADSALLLEADALLRFDPVEHYNGKPGSLTAHAVDSAGSITFTEGNTRETFDTTSDDATSSVSDAGVILSTTINAVNDAPVFTTSNTLSTSENIKEVATLEATDVEKGTITYSLTGGADQSLFTLDTDSGALSFVDAPNFESPKDQDEDNVYDVTVTADDGQGGKTPLSLEVTVTNVNERSPSPIRVTPNSSDDSLPDTPSGRPSVSETISTTGSRSGTAKLVENTGNDNEVTVTLPGGTSLVNQGARSAVNAQQAIADLIGSIDAKQPGNLDDQSSVATDWLSNRPDGSLLDIRTLVLNDNRSASTGTPIQIMGNADGGAGSSGHQEAFVIDTTGLPEGNLLQLDNIEFASVVGATSITGGEGNNVIVADDAAQTIVLGEGDDELYGGGGDDTVGSEDGDDRLFGDSGDDELFGGAGADLLHGGSDTDVARYEGNRDEYLITQDHSVITVQNKEDASDIDTLVNVESLVFADGEENITYDDDLTWITGLYDQVLGRQADVDGIQYWAQQHAAGLSKSEMALLFMTSPEAGQSLDMQSAGIDSVVDTLYASLLGRDADASGKAYWASQMESGVSLHHVVGGFMAAEEMRTHDLNTTQWDFIA